MESQQMFDEDEVRSELKRIISTRFNGNASAAARRWSIRPDYLCHVISGPAGVSDRIARLAGFRKVAAFVPERGGKDAAS